MDEASMPDSSGSFMIGSDMTQPDRLIEGSFVDAWRRCVKVMPRVWFKNSSFAGQTLHPDLPAGTGYIELPDNFYLLTGFKMAGWVKAVYEAYIENDRTASIQSNKYTRGSTVRPACTVSNKLIDGQVKQVLNYYSLPRGLSAHTVEEAIYVPVAGSLQNLTDDDDLGISDQVMEPLAYLSASTVLTMLQKHDLSKALEQRAVEMLPGLQSVSGDNITFKQ
jgi:hypothetical protein